MHLKLRYFASLREALGTGEAVEVGPEVVTAGRLRDWLIARGGLHAERLARGRALRCAVNQQLADDDTPLAEGAEVAFFPPVTGG